MFLLHGNAKTVTAHILADSNNFLFTGGYFFFDIGFVALRKIP